MICEPEGNTELVGITKPAALGSLLLVFGMKSIRDLNDRINLIVSVIES